MGLTRRATLSRVQAGAEGPAPLAVGVIGCGYWGPNLVRNCNENETTRVVAVADLREDRLRAIERKAPGARLTTVHAEVLADPAVEAVAITTPVSSHFELGRAALEAGKHVLMAKPLAATTHECEALVALAAENDRVLLVDHTFVYTGAVRKIRSLLDEGALGEIYYCDSVRVNLGLFQHDVNVIWDLAPHDFAILRYLFDREPVAVSATGAAHSASGLEDVAYVTLHYEGNLIAHCHLNWLSPVKIRRTLIGGSERMLVWDDLDPDEKIKIYDRGFSEQPRGSEGLYETIVSYRIGDVWIPQVERGEALAREVEHFARCVRGLETPLTPGQAGADVVRLLEAANASVQAGGRPVAFEEFAGR
jgi:predicted dehydrogenase